MPWPEIPAAALASGCRSTNVSVPEAPAGRTRPCQPELPADLPTCALAAKGLLSFLSKEI